MREGHAAVRSLLEACKRGIVRIRPAPCDLAGGRVLWGRSGEWRGMESNFAVRVLSVRPRLASPPPNRRARGIERPRVPQAAMSLSGSVAFSEEAGRPPPALPKEASDDFGDGDASIAFSDTSALSKPAGRKASSTGKPVGGKVTAEPSISFSEAGSELSKPRERKPSAEASIAFSDTSLLSKPAERKPSSTGKPAGGKVTAEPSISFSEAGSELSKRTDRTSGFQPRQYGITFYVSVGVVGVTHVLLAWRASELSPLR